VSISYLKIITVFWNLWDNRSCEYGERGSESVCKVVVNPLPVLSFELKIFPHSVLNRTGIQKFISIKESVTVHYNSVSCKMGKKVEQLVKLVTLSATLHKGNS
jgi:hypothetical protein